MKNTKRISILGINVDNVSFSALLTKIHRFIDEAGPHQICTVNIEFINSALSNSEFKNTINSADFSIADGAGILLASKLLGFIAPEKISGVDLTYKICEESANQGYRVFLLGGQNNVGKKAGDILKSLYPALNIVGYYEGSPEDKSVISQIRTANPHILFVAWGAPKQDIWISKNKHELNVPVMMGVGGTFDFIAGVQVRAPKSWRESGFEWLWRLAREPWRWRRQLALPKVILMVLLQRIGLYK